MGQPVGLRDHLLRGPGVGWAWLAHRALTGRRAWIRVEVGPLPAARRAPLLQQLRRVVCDPLIAGVLLHVKGSPGGWAAVQDWRDVIGVLRAGRRWVEAHIEDPSGGALAVATAADRVTCPEGATVVTLGAGTITTHQQALLSRLGVSVDVVTAGAFKSAGEPWSRRYASPSAREALAALLGDLDAQWAEAVQQDRGLTADEVSEAGRRGWMTPREAVKAGWIDGVGSLALSEVSLGEHAGAHASPVSLDAWALRDQAIAALERSGQRERVAVVHLQGPIQAEDGGRGPRVRMPLVLEALERLRIDDDVVGVVLVVDSPGGGVMPSQRIADGVARLGRHKPVVASYADVAASGGVLISAPCHRVLSRPGTVTGSVGVVAGKLVARDALRWAGVSPEAVGQGAWREAMSVMRPFTPDERARMEHALEEIYVDFVAQVARGRGRTPQDLEPACRGRVWTGRQAVERGLVDGLGGVQDAVQLVLSLAGWPVEEPAPACDHADPCQLGPLETLRRTLENSSNPQGSLEGWVSEGLGPLAAAVVTAPGAPQAVWPWGAVPKA